MTLGGQMNDAGGLIMRKESVQRLPIADVGPLEHISRTVRDGVEGAQIGCIGKLVDVYDEGVVCIDEQPADCGADESGAPGYKNARAFCSFSMRRLSMKVNRAAL